jgi:hypothetical protein
MNKIYSKLLYFLIVVAVSITTRGGGGSGSSSSIERQRRLHCFRMQIFKLEFAYMMSYNAFKANKTIRL